LLEESEKVGASAQTANLRLVVEQPGETLVMGRESDLGLMVHNLLDNAIRYTQPGGEVRLSLLLEDHEAVIRVDDTGIGIPGADLERVFERFYRVDAARSRETGGTGLGLSIVRHVAESHHGEVRVRSVLGAGTTFTVRLPVTSR
jgi:signal transduction histidine kinase